MSESRSYVLAEIEGEPTMLLFRSDEQAASWALNQRSNVRLRECKVRIGAELIAEPPGPPTLRVAPGQIRYEKLSEVNE